MHVDMHMVAYGIIWPPHPDPFVQRWPEARFFSLWRSLEADVFASIMINYDQLCIKFDMR